MEVAHFDNTAEQFVDGAKSARGNLQPGDYAFEWDILEEQGYVIEVNEKGDERFTPIDEWVEGVAAMTGGTTDLILDGSNVYVPAIAVERKIVDISREKGILEESY